MTPFTLSGVARPFLQETISEGPPTLETAIELLGIVPDAELSEGSSLVNELRRLSETRGSDQPIEKGERVRIVSVDGLTLRVTKQ